MRQFEPALKFRQSQWPEDCRSCASCGLSSGQKEFYYTTRINRVLVEADLAAMTRHRCVVASGRTLLPAAEYIYGL